MVAAALVMGVDGGDGGDDDDIPALAVYTMGDAYGYDVTHDEAEGFGIFFVCFLCGHAYFA